MNEQKLKVDRVEEGIAVCYAPNGCGMVNVPLPDDLIGNVPDGAVITVKYEDDTVVSVELSEVCDPRSTERRKRLNRLFGKK